MMRYFDSTASRRDRCEVGEPALRGVNIIPCTAAVDNGFFGDCEKFGFHKEGLNLIEDMQFLNNFGSHLGNVVNS